MNNKGLRKVADKSIEKNGLKRQQQQQRTLLRKPSFAYRKSVQMPLLLFRVFINRGDKNMLVKMLNVYMVCSNKPNGLVSLDIYGMPKKVDMAIQLVLRFIHYEETTSVRYNVSREKYEALYHSNPNVFKEIGTKNGVLLAVVNSTTNPRHQMDVTITGRRMQIDNATKALAELFFPKFECAICFAEFLIEAGMVTCEKQFHSICVECFQTYSHTSITDQVAYGGIGLRCVDLQCDSAILLSSFGFYVLEADYRPLVCRLQQQCIIDADMNDLVKCSQCDFKLSVDPTLAYFKCICGRFQCRTCARPYNQKHKGKTCAQVNEDEAKENSATKIEFKQSETVIRKCHKPSCNVPFVKDAINGACNKMTCPLCKATMCYICSARDIGYDHFCRCGNTAQQHGKCPRCKKTCRLWENAEELDEMRIKHLKRINT